MLGCFFLFPSFFPLLVSWRFFSTRDSQDPSLRVAQPQPPWCWRAVLNPGLYIGLPSQMLSHGGYDVEGGRVWYASHLKVTECTLCFFLFNSHFHPLYPDTHPHYFPETDPTSVPRPMFLFNVPLMGLHTCVRLPPLTFWPSSQGSSFSACVLSVNASSDFCPCFCFFFNVCFVPLLNRGPQTFLDIALTGEFSKLHTARPLQIVLWGQLRFLSSSCESDVHQKLRNTALLPENVTHHHCLLTLESHTLWSSKSFP